LESSETPVFDPKTPVFTSKTGNYFGTFFASSKRPDISEKISELL